MELRPLGIVKEIVEAVGMDISYMYEDLVFIDHNAFLLQFTDDTGVVLIRVNRSARENELEGAIARLKKEAAAKEMVFIDGGRYEISQDGDDNLRIEFFE